MNENKVKTKFTIQFNQFDPSHLQVAEILNYQPMRGKARYIVNAVIFYESRNGSSIDTKSIPSVDESCVESIMDKALSIMDKILLDRAEKGTGITPAAAPLKQETLKQEPFINQQPIGANGLNAVASTLDMFRNR